MREFDKRSKDFPRGDPGQVSFKSFLPIMKIYCPGLPDETFFEPCFDYVKRYKQKSFDHKSEGEIISSRPTSK